MQDDDTLVATIQGLPYFAREQLPLVILIDGLHMRIAELEMKISGIKINYITVSSRSSYKKKEIITFAKRAWLEAFVDGFKSKNYYGKVVAADSAIKRLLEIYKEGGNYNAVNYFLNVLKYVGANIPQDVISAISTSTNSMIYNEARATLLRNIQNTEVKLARLRAKLDVLESAGKQK